MIEVTNLTKKYGDSTAVDNLSFTVDKGQIYGFLGPNGAGKSTTMNIITGYTAATEGKVVINGHDILEEPLEARKCIGYLPEIPPLYQDMTVGEYLDFAAELKGIEKEKRGGSVDDVEELLKIKSMDGRLIRNLSKGYRQRVGFAMALLGFPEIIILDEPTVGLDPQQMAEIRDLIKELGKNHTVILSSHILSEVSLVCDHIMIISKGRLAASDSTENLMKMMQPETVLTVTALADKRTVEKVIEGIEDTELQSIEETEDGNTKAEIRYGSDMDRRKDIASAFAAAGCAVIEMNTEKTSLEEVFLELTADEEKEKTAADIVADADSDAEDLSEAVDSVMESGSGDAAEDEKDAGTGADQDTGDSAEGKED
ncbi:MAG: ABC transporter ATP-binding protein [Anaerovoracaceae bacterium]|nr:ABC transporter ATP-binding protein [Bacillota bacterium]MDY2670332.1 ABC transporter ATP-binding protein [Anaerovoracaceae bacterium]